MIIYVWKNDHLPKAFTWKMTGNENFIMGNGHLPKAFILENVRKMLLGWKMLLGSGKCFWGLEK